MSELTKALEEYLMVRRAVGYKLKLSEYMLRSFVAELDHLGIERITTDAALAWATRPAGAQPSWWAQRRGAVRCFARFLHAVDPVHEVPPPGLLTAKARRSTRHVYCETDVLSLMKAAAALEPALRAAT
jgi:integrase/recombinase XerD